MFAYLKGNLASFTATQAIIDVQGVGYAILIPFRVMEELPPLGEPVQFHTSFVVREFSHALYGFLSASERDVFELLINITGVGPKLALSLIGHLTLPGLHDAVARQNLPALCRVPGVGKKTAERLLVELKGKLSNLIACEAADYVAAQVDDPQSRSVQDAILALVNLGYTQSTAQKAVKQSLKDLPESIDAGSLITHALQNI